MRQMHRTVYALIVIILSARVLHGEDQSATTENAPADLPPAADLVREVRASEQWIHQIKSLQITFDEITKRDPRGIAESIDERKKKGQSIDPQVVIELRPSYSSVRTLTFDGKRYRLDTKSQDDLYECRELWDGMTCFNYYRWKNTLPHLSITSTAYFSNEAFDWLLGDVHVFDGDDPNAKPKLYPPEDFLTVGREKFRGVDCWRLVTTKNGDAWPTRWFVGVTDNRLYGMWEGACGNITEEMAAFHEFAAADGQDLTTQDDVKTWFTNLSKERQKEVQEKYKEWVGRHGSPASEWWFADYVQIRPGIWFPKRHGYQNYSFTLQADGTNGGLAYPDHMVEMDATDVKVDEAIPDDIFTLASLHVPDGALVGDSSHEPPLEYSYKANFTPEEWQAILDAADKRQAANEQAVAAQQRAKAVKAAEEALKPPLAPP